MICNTLSMNFFSIPIRVYCYSANHIAKIQTFAVQDIELIKVLMRSSIKKNTQYDCFNLFNDLCKILKIFWHRFSMKW